MVGLVGDLELVAVPRMEADLLGPTGHPDLLGLEAELEKMGRRVKGGERYLRYAGLLGSALDLDLFLVHPPAEWGSIFAIRTGPAALGRYCVQKMRDELGLRHVDGHVRDARTGELRPTPTERDFFELAQVELVSPEHRAALAQRLGAW
jgi:DNA polymerase/3'-5' exonuclease PolX